MNNLTINTNLITMIQNLNTALVNNNAADLHNFYLQVSELSTIERYYMLKGFKLANEVKFYDSCYGSSDKEFARDIMRVLLTELYNINDTNQDNYDAAYAGMGNIDAYKDAFAQIIK